MNQGESDPLLEPKFAPEARQAPVRVYRVGVVDPALEPAVMSNTVFNQSLRCPHAVIIIDTCAVVNHRHAVTVDW